MHQKSKYGAIAISIMLLAWQDAAAGLHLRNAVVERLDNGLTVILLEDRNFPVVSTQMLYRVGARDESYGHTGLAHFLEHMAFRDSENFPDTGLVSSIYAVGGEWHGYTWTDETTYFATVPKEELGLLLSIEADRMSRLRISPDDMEAERGAVLAEMHMYENYPTSMLLDAVLFTSFFAHPYRNNTIGWESDIEALEHPEVVAFYERHYHPANAVLAIVGDFDRRQVLERVETLFGKIEAKAPTRWPHTVEPVQEGERRVRLHAETDVRRFMIAWRAPSANHEDFAAFLVLQELLGAGSGVNFRQNDWGTPLDDGALLEGLADEVTTWYPPSAQDYIFIVGGTIPPEDRESRLEEDLEERLAGVRRRVTAPADLQAAIDRVIEELEYDVETTEDAAHQLAFFDGLGALDTLLRLPQRVRAVTGTDVQRVARRWLLPERRTIGWHVPGQDTEKLPIMEAPPSQAEKNNAPDAPPGPPDREPVPGPEMRELRGGVPVILQQSDLSQAAFLQVVLPGSDVAGAGVRRSEPVAGYSSVAWRFVPEDLRKTVARAREAVEAARVGVDLKRDAPTDPETAIEQVFASRMSGNEPAQGTTGVSPALVVVSGDLATERVFELLDEAFGGMPAGQRVRSRPSANVNDRHPIEVHLERPVAQAQLGYIVAVPGPAEEASWAHRILLYILSHDYEGRLGTEAISNRGLAYYIDSRYRSDGANAWITLAVGVDPAKLPDLKNLLQAELERLQKEPPSHAEIEEAKRHFTGRARSASQSNAEISSALAEQWLWYGKLLTADDLERRLRRVDREAVLDAVSSFIDGATVVVTE
ncbi:MAG TPA: insulinase family protein [Woeseiaceae bacterium]|nr:insulinase family protein [Woeseiaceae bacterium]